MLVFVCRPCAMPNIRLQVFAQNGPDSVHDSQKWVESTLCQQFENGIRLRKYIIQIHANTE